MQYEKLSFRKKTGVFLALTLFFVATHPAETRAQLGSAVRQVVVGQPANWTSNTASLQCYQRLSAHSPWKPAFARPIPVLLGKKGLAWGQGVFHAPASAIAAKVEKDLKSPAGIFHLGILFGYAVTPPHGVRWPYIQVGPWDAYVDDSSLPFYNKHVRIDPRQGIPPWFERQRMRLGDAAYRWMLEIRHNQHPPLPGYGSAIFFHVRRGPNTPTAGCTALAEVDLVRLLQWLDPKATPHYVLLPKAEYAALRGIWGLP